MREILFRGKTTLDNEWVVGAGVYKSEGYTWIITDDATKTENRGTGSDAINPETIGQYAGITDKNGKKIFEGDIVYNGVFKSCVEFYDGRFTPFSGEHHTFFADECTIIGNIHDNPELMQGDNQ